MGIWTKERWDNEVEAVRKLYKNDPLKIYNQHYYHKRRKMRDWEMKSGKILSETLNIKTMIDFGCGLGSYLEGALEGKTEKVFGIDIGYDFSKKVIPEHMHKFIVKGDVGKEFNYGKWDCVLSLEVAEHLLPEEEDTFILNLFNASSRLIVFSASRDFSYMHINGGKAKEYWIKKFIDLGCKELLEEEKKLCAAWKGYCSKYIVRQVIILSVGLVEKV